MFTLRGKCGEAKVFTDLCDENAIQQIISLLNQPISENAVIRIMPDVHAGAGCTIGTTMTLTDRVIPNLVGVDIGCGMLTVLLKEREIDFENLDRVIREHVPSGFSIREIPHLLADPYLYDHLHCLEHVDQNRALHSIGTLGGGNHFIEVDRDDDDRLYLVIHSGSRHLGKQVAEYYQMMAVLTQRQKEVQRLQEIIDRCKAEGRDREIQSILQAEKKKLPSVPDDLAYVEGDLFYQYIDDMRIAQRYASVNRTAIAYSILKNAGLDASDQFTTIHNYIDTDSMILRKGAVSARADELLLIPINMRDGSLLCVGLGNADWNFSAPHGAGRLMSRGSAKEALSLDEFRKEMQGVYSTSVSAATLDESPMAYKSLRDILPNISETAALVKRLSPVYNFKAS